MERQQIAEQVAIAVVDAIASQTAGKIINYEYEMGAGGLAIGVLLGVFISNLQRLYVAWRLRTKRRNGQNN